MGISIALTQLKRKERKDGTIPVYIRVTKDRKHRYKATGISIVEKCWDESEKLIKESCKNSFRLNKQLQTMLQVFEGRVEKLIQEGEDSLDNLKKELSRVVEEYRSQPHSVYRSGGKSLEAAKQIVNELEDRGFYAQQFFFNQMRLIAYTKEYQLDGEDFAEVSDTKFLYKEDLADLYDHPTLLGELVDDIEDSIEKEKNDFLNKTSPYNKIRD